MFQFDRFKYFWKHLFSHVTTSSFFLNYFGKFVAYSVQVTFRFFPRSNLVPLCQCFVLKRIELFMKTQLPWASLNQRLFYSNRTVNLFVASLYYTMLHYIFFVLNRLLVISVIVIAIISKRRCSIQTTKDRKSVV